MDSKRFDYSLFNREMERGGRMTKQRWIPVSERLPETDNKNSINNYNVLLWVKNKSHPEREPQICLGKLRHIDGDDGSGNFWGIETKPCEWTIWGWSYFNEPEVIAWMPLPEPYIEIEDIMSDISTANVIERSKIDKAIEEIQEFEMSHRINVMDWEDIIPECLEILKENIGE